MSDGAAAPGTVRQLLRSARLLLLDFDGPVTAVYADVPAADVARSLRSLLVDRGVEIPARLYLSDDPLDFVRWASTATTADHQRAVEARLTDLERQAIQTATPTPGADALLRAALARDLPIRIVSNNSPEAITDFLNKHDLAHYVVAVHGRSPDHPDRMKPNSWTILQTLNDASSTAAEAVLLGDSVSDVVAALTAEVPCIGLANKPGKRDKLADAGALVIVNDMHAVADALYGAPALP